MGRKGTLRDGDVRCQSFGVDRRASKLASINKHAPDLNRLVKMLTSLRSLRNAAGTLSHGIRLVTRGNKVDSA